MRFPWLRRGVSVGDEVSTALICVVEGRECDLLSESCLEWVFSSRPWRDGRVAMRVGMEASFDP